MTAKKISCRLTFVISASLICVAVSLPAFAGTKPAASEQSLHCISGEPEPVDPIFESLRAQPTAKCDYDLNNLYRRIEQLFAVKNRALRVELVEKLFSLPQMTTLFDAERSANYSITLTGVDGWKAQISFDESFFPTDRQRQPKFVGEFRPKLINPRERGDMDFDLRILSQVARTSNCLKISSVLDRAERTGWKDQTRWTHVTDGGPHMPTFGRNDGRSFSIYVPMAGYYANEQELEGCLTDIRFNQPGTGK